MKKLLLLSIPIICVYLIGISTSQPPQTLQNTCLRVHYADSNDSALTGDTSSYSVTSLWTAIPSNYNGFKIQFYASDTTDPNDATFNYSLYIADYGGNAQKVADGNCIVGASKLSHNPISLAKLHDGSDPNYTAGEIDPNSAWVDTLGEVTSEWFSVTRQNYGGNNDVAGLIFDRESGKTIWCRIYNRSSATLKVSVIGYGY